MTGYRSLARNHDFSVLWVGQTVSELGSAVSMFVFPLLAFALTHSPVQAGLVEAAHLLGMCAALLPAGVLADRTDRQRVMRMASAAGVLLYASLVVAGLMHALTIPHLVVVALLTGVATGCFGPAETSAVRAVVSTEELPTALSQNQARQHVASLVGGPIGGLLYGVTRWLPFAADALSFAVSWVMLGRIRTDLSAPVHEGPRPSPRQDIAEGLRFILARPFFRALLVYAALSNLVVNGIFFVAIIRLIRAGFHPAEIGLVETAAGIGGLLGAVAAPTIIDRMATGRLTVIGAWSFVPLVIPIIFWNNPLVVAFALGVGLLLNPAGNAGISAYAIAQTPDHLQGRMGAATRFLAMSVMPLAPVLGGVLLSTLGGPAAVAAMAVATALCALVPTLARSVRDVPRPIHWQAELAAAAPAEAVSAGR
ncbi:MFS transporter [Nocardioides sp. LS1]|uniref:MFS transporter n=1 Tax=Nocardioides sp. LS1 TaxID=1027620 RepID=UPI000F61A88C|nr:MFS transporter [Nocardioides sp. LS1]GCD90561.1 MFS transporter [Nocardioides sp. LS1]